jgi:exodeoxyribonuclease V alpha subunit
VAHEYLDRLIAKAEFTGSTAISEDNIKHQYVSDKYVVANGLVGKLEHFTTEKHIYDTIKKINDKTVKKHYVASPALPNNIDLNQISAIQSFLTNPLTLVNGAAGTGKTYTIKVLVDVLTNVAGIAVDDIAICASIGVVASKLGSICGVKGFTINRLLGYELKEGLYQAQKNSLNPLKQNYIIVDEATLISNSLILALLSAMGADSRILIAGDDRQVGSIAPGAFFNSLLNSTRFKRVMLENNYRNAQTSIEHLASDVANDLVDDSLDSYRSKELSIIDKRTNQDTYDFVLQVFERAIDRGGVLNDFQILTPIHDGPLGTIALNALAVGLTPNAEGYKVILKKTNYRRTLFNGQLGVCHQLRGRKRVKIGKQILDFDNNVDFNEKVEFAYALTPHRVQGAEFDLVIIVLPIGSQMVNANWLYSAITRAKKSLAIVGDVTLINNAVRNHRQTFLNSIIG